MIPLSGEPFIPATSGLSGTTHHIDVTVTAFTNLIQRPGFAFEGTAFSTLGKTVGTFNCPDNDVYGYPLDYGYDPDYLVLGYSKYYSGRTLQEGSCPYIHHFHTRTIYIEYQI